MITRIKILNFLIFLFIISFLFESTFNLYFQKSTIRVSLVEIIFIIFFLYLILAHKNKIIKNIFTIKNLNIFEYTIILILFLKIFKYLLDFYNLINLYELLIWIYMLSIYFVIKYILIFNKLVLNNIENSFIFLSILLSLIIYFSFFCYLLGFDFNFLWEIKNDIHYPYLGEGSIHFFGIVSGQNQACYLLLPGFFIFLHKYKTKNYFNIFLIFFILAFILIKAKATILVFGFIIFYFFMNIKNVRKSITIRSLILIYFLVFVIYFFLTHFLYLSENTINDNNFELYNDYYTKNSLFKLFSLDFYGSLFLKLKHVAIDLNARNDYFFFNETNILQYNPLYEEYGVNFDGAGELFSALGNYGILGFLLYSIVIYYFLLLFYKNFKNKNFYNNNISFLIIVGIYSIESIVTEFLHYQYIWVIFAILSNNNLKNINNNNNNNN